jgi:hypothetical protein
MTEKFRGIKVPCGRCGYERQWQAERTNGLNLCSSCRATMTDEEIEAWW